MGATRDIGLSPANGTFSLRAAAAAVAVAGEGHRGVAHACAVEVNGDCSCLESHPYDRIPNCATQDGPKCNACDAGHVLEENAWEVDT